MQKAGPVIIEIMWLPWKPVHLSVSKKLHVHGTLFLKTAGCHKN